MEALTRLDAAARAESGTQLRETAAAVSSAGSAANAVAIDLGVPECAGQSNAEDG